MFTNQTTEFLDRCRITSPSHPLIIVAGSGISCSSPANLPSARQMVDKVIEFMSPLDMDAGDQDGLSRILPEIYYEILEEIYGRKILDVWQCLDF